MSRTSRRDVTVLMVAACACLMLQGRDLKVPLIPGDAVVRSSALLPLLLTVPLVAISANPLRSLEATLCGSRITRARLAWGVVLAAGGAASSALIACAGDRDGISPAGAALNALCFTGLGLIFAAVLGADLAWAGPCLLALGTFYFGKDLDNQVRGWAWLLHDPTHVGSWGMSGLFCLVGLAAYMYFDSTGLLRRRLGV